MTDIDWANLPFGYMPTDYNVRCYYKNGKWGEIEVSSSETINIHMAATCLHYGQESFEGQKAFRCPDGKIRIFRIEDNAARMQSTSRGILMPEMPTDKFVEMVKKVVKLNERFVPPYESGAALYIRRSKGFAGVIQQFPCSSFKKAMLAMEVSVRKLCRKINTSSQFSRCSTQCVIPLRSVDFSE